VGWLRCFLGLGWVSPPPAAPANIAWLAFAYSLLTWSGMAVFGSETWIKHGEVFAIFFGLFARFAPTEPRIHKQSGAHGLALRPLGAGGLGKHPPSPPMGAVVPPLLLRGV